ncbi:MAG: UDP-N-acetylglucosamine 2-epimerase (hydrolyzing), partial [Alphaproteobacteria bacterium]|nr:UDP-N-acetylglucosamine 2-epimerase (hydrolyzing) [Alphaproteobacteria bacterium]
RPVIAVVTTARSDYGILRPVVRELHADADLSPYLIVGGGHMESRFGNTIEDIRREGFVVGAEVPMELTVDTPAGIARSMARAIEGFAACFEARRPDVLVVLGDRFDMHAAALAALPFNFAVAHIHGGELTYGAFDDALRHSLTKLSHLHFTATESYRDRVIQLGEEPWRVHATGGPGLDAVLNTPRWTDAELEARIGMPLDPAPLLVTYHPVTRETDDTERQIDTFLAALGAMDMPVVITGSNADTNNSVIRARIDAFVAAHERVGFVENFGTAGYVTMMSRAAAMVGNSSSGIIEAASLDLPVVNVGNRQAGRVRGSNVIDVADDADAIAAAIRKAVSPEFKAGLAGMTNPYGDGQAARRIVAHLKASISDPRLLNKRFHDTVVN